MTTTILGIFGILMATLVILVIGIAIIFATKSDSGEGLANNLGNFFDGLWGKVFRRQTTATTTGLPALPATTANSTPSNAKGTPLTKIDSLVTYLAILTPPVIIAIICGVILDCMMDNSPAAWTISTTLASISWIAIYIIWGYIEVQEGKFEIVKRFGKIVGVKKPGMRLLCLPGLIDERVKDEPNYSLLKRRLIIFDQGASGKREFTLRGGGAVSMVVQLVGRIVDPLQFVLATGDQTGAETIAWIGTMTGQWVQDQFEGITLEEAREKHKKLSPMLRNGTNGAKEVADNLLALGFKIDERDPLDITDFDVSDETAAIEREGLKGKAQGIEISSFIGEIKKLHPDATQEELLALWREMKVLSTVEKTNATLFLGADSILGAFGRLGIQPKSKKGKDKKS